MVPKLSSVGLIASHWEIVPFSKVCDESAFGPRFSGQMYHPEGNIATLRTTDLDDQGRICYLKMPLAKLDIKRFEKHFLKPGDLIITRSGTCGIAAVFEGFHLPVLPGAFSIRFRLSSHVDPYFFRYYFNSTTGRKRVLALTTGTVQPNLTSTALLNLSVPLPPLPEQKAIAHILGTLDDKIELNREMNKTLEAMAQAIFKSWFLDFDPVRAKMEGRQPAGMDAATAELFPDEFEESALGMIPKGWTIKKLSEVTTKIGSGATPRGGSQVYVQEGISLIRSQNIYDYEFKWEGLARITEETAEQLKNVIVEPNDILFNITGDSILRTCVVEPAVLPARVNQHVAIIRTKPDIPCRYLHLYLVQQQIKQHLLGFDAGGTRKAVTKGQLESVPVPIPTQSILFCFQQIVDALFARVNANLEKSRTLASIRDTLLPKLLSGEIRVKEADKIVETQL
jgi:type I restriction enzyme S subunit